MTRLQKKCMVFSLGLHGLLAVLLLASAAFRSRPPQTDLQIMTMIPANIVDRAGAGGGTPVVNLAPTTQAAPRAQPQPQPQPQPLPRPQPVRAEPVARAQIPVPRAHAEMTRPQPAPDPSEELALESKPKPKPPTRPPRHPIEVSFTPASASAKEKKSDKTHASESSAQAEARQLKTIEDSLGQLASGVKSSGSPNAIVDVEGIGGGEAFAGYRDVVFSAYYHAWITPDTLASRTASADARVIIARDGRIVSAELVRPSDDRTLDKSVEQALRRVTQLPPFPASARDMQRTFLLHFSPEAKEMSG
jgi:periplasmic protein TonB